MVSVTALGMIETIGLVSAIEAADAGLKAAQVRLLGTDYVRGGLVMVLSLIHISEPTRP